MIDIAHTMQLKYNYFNKGVIMGAKIDLKGKKFNRLLVIEDDDSKKRTAYKCLCDCGKEVVVTSDRLASNKTKSCGCLNEEHKKNFGKHYGIKPRHGMTKSPTWKSWGSMVYRCTKETGRQYSVYGGMLCDRWKIFENFLEDMGERPSGKTIDRVDVTKGYFKENCRWATPKEQQNNRNNTRYLSVNGNKISVMDFAAAIELRKNEAQHYFSVMKKIKDKGHSVCLWEF